MFSKSKPFILFFFLIWLLPSAEARHIIGGEITYECLGMDTIRNEVTYRFKCIVYRDCFGGGAELDGDFNFGIYHKSEEGWVVERVEQAFLSDVAFISLDSTNPCVIVPRNVCVQKGEYHFDITLPIRDNNYMVAFQRCCRNNTISNIFNPGDQGAAYTIEITPEAQRSCNNSPAFRSFPPVVICADEPLDYDHGANDTENDDLVYEFCAPLTAGGMVGVNGQPCPPPRCDCVIPMPNFCLPPFQEVQFIAPTYTSTRPLPGDPLVRIDPVTGLITGTPNILGQFVVGVCVKEYRNGVLLSTFRRDFQFNVTFCEPTVVAQVEANGDVGMGDYLINSCGENELDFINRSFNEDFIEDYHWEFFVNGEIDTFDTKNVTYEFPGVGQYRALMAINRKFTCADTVNMTINVYPDIEADFVYDYDTCVAGAVTFTDSSFSGSGNITDWEWDFNGDGQSTNQNPNHNFTTPGVKDVSLKVTDINECEDEISDRISYFPVPPVIIIEPTSFTGCVPARITFENLSTPIDESYDIVWDFGDGGMSGEISPTHVYTEPGNYNVKISITSPINCFTSAEFNSWIRVEPSPTANFTFSPTELNSFQKTVNFTDQSIGADSWQWSFDGDGVLFDQNPSWTFADTGIHRIELIVVHPSGCPDTMVQIIDVVPVNTYFMPNAYTPNRDGKNDVFKGVGIVEGMTNFSMSIWNRWGERVFLTDDPEIGWNGQLNNEGRASPEGVYVYQVEYVDPRGNREELKGYVTLIR